MRIFLTLIFVSFSFLSFSQQLETSMKKNTIYAELLGQGALWSINYERMFEVNDFVSQSASVGLTTNRNLRDLFFDQSFFDFGNDYNFGTPIAYRLIFGKRNSHLELGIGLTGLYFKGAGSYHDGFCMSYSSDIRRFNSYIVPTIAYRFQQKTGGIFFKVSYSPLFSFYQTDNLDYVGGRTNKNKFFEKSNNLLLWPGLSLGYTF
jgi:hypothetical protein